MKMQLDLRHFHWDNSGMFKNVALLITFLIFSQSLYAEEAGYKEAMEYFVHRKNQKQKNAGNYVEKAESQALQEYLPEAYKFFISAGAGENLELGFYSFEIGATVLAGEYLQQSVSLEYNRTSTKDSDGFRSGASQNTYATGIFFNHSIALNSRKFYFSPELSMGVGRIFGAPDEGALIILKPGLAFTSRWNKGLMYSAHIYYRRNQYFSKNSNGDGLGFNLRISY
jgi:hypothetical protein